MPRTTLRNSVQTTLRQLRLDVGNALMAHIHSTDSIRSYMQDSDQLLELCDEYAFRLLTIVLSKGDLGDFFSYLQSRGEYPFASEAFPLFDVARLSGCRSDISSDVSLLGSLYEEINQFPGAFNESSYVIDKSGLDKTARKRSGQYYTPIQAARLCLEDGYADRRQSLVEAVNRAQQDPSGGHSMPKILDPSCGTGNFLTGALQWLTDALSTDAAFVLAKQALWGFELDGRAVALARLSVVLCLAALRRARNETTSSVELIALFDSLKKHIRVSDTTFGAPEAMAGCEGAPHDERSAGENSFALVITNPPYVSFGARDQQALLDEQKVFLKNKYPSSAEYKIRLHSIFQEISLRYAAPGGRVVLLVPDAFLTGIYYEKLRSLITREAQIVSITELPPSTFSDAVVGQWSIAVYEKGVLEPREHVRIRALQRQSDTITDFALPKEIFFSPLKTRFRLISSEQDREICQRTDKLRCFSSLLRGHTGMRALHGQGSIISDSEGSGGTWNRGLKSGSAVRAFSVHWDGTWIDVDDAKLFKGGFDPQVIANPKILVRQTGDRIVAAIDTSGLYHLNNLHSFSMLSPKLPPSTTALATGSRLTFLTGLLNSSAMCHLYRMRTREEGRALAQVDIETLEDLPIPADDDLLEEEISSLVQLVMTLSADAESADEVVKIKRKIDSLVYELFGFDKSVVAHMERVGVG